MIGGTADGGARANLAVDPLDTATGSAADAAANASAATAGHAAGHAAATTAATTAANTAADPSEHTAAAAAADAEHAAVSGDGMYFYGVVRARGWRVGRTSDGEAEAVARVRFRDIEALVRPAPFELPPLDEAHVLAHQRTVEAIMRGGTILPAPYGVVFRGRRHVVSLLQDQYLVLDEGLSLLDGNWELRLHLSPASRSDEGAGLGEVASTVYSELRRYARAAVPFPREGKRLLSAAFLVEQARWIEFMDRSDDLGNAHPELSFDVTGPWPAYDFVRIL